MALRVKRRSRDRQGRVSVRRLGLVYKGGGVLRDLRGTSRDIELLRAARVPGGSRAAKKEPQRKKE